MAEGPESNLKEMRGINAAERQKGFCTVNAVERYQEDGIKWKKKVI